VRCGGVCQRRPFRGSDLSVRDIELAENQTVHAPDDHGHAAKPAIGRFIAAGRTISPSTIAEPALIT
jgi:hypothetical protein